MVKFMKTVGAAVMVAGWCGCTAHAWGGKDKKEEEKTPEMPKGKEAVDLARAGFRQAAGDVGLIQDLLKDMKDPETMKQVEELMKDKKFKKEVDELVNSAEWKEAYGDTLKYLSDPEAMATMQKQAEEYTNFLAAGPGKDGRMDASMGLEAAANAMKDPKFLQETMEMMKDPAVMKQVEETMKNPDFQKTMKQMMDSPGMKAQLAQAGKSMEEMMKDPKMMEEAQKYINAMMSSAGEL